MKFGLFHTVQWPAGTDQQERYRISIEEAVFAEEIGFDSIWFTEHHFSRHGIVSDSLAMLAYLAARTERVRLGTAVSVLPLHNPVRLAEAAGTVDVLSGGRLDLGLGNGYQVGEFRGMGVSMDDRRQRFDEAIEVMLALWEGTGPVDFDGAYYRFEGADPQPKPVQLPHPPIWVATDSDDGFRRAAERNWGVLLPQGRSVDAVAAQLARYRTALDAAGRPFDPEKVILARALYCAPTDEQAWDDARRPYVDFLTLAGSLAGPEGTPSQKEGDPNQVNAGLEAAVVFGSPESCIHRIGELHELGLERMMFFVHFANLPHERIMQSLALFHDEVLPAVRALAPATV